MLEIFIPTYQTSVFSSAQLFLSVRISLNLLPAQITCEKHCFYFLPAFGD